MSKTLVMVEVSRKQDYIFSSNRIKENALRSAEIAYVTSSDYFCNVAGAYYKEENNLVYAGGGHTILQFDTPSDAFNFSRAVSLRAMQDFDGMELFLSKVAYDSQLSPGANLLALTKALEKKKALRKDSFRRLSFGVETLNSAYQPETIAPIRNFILPEKYRLPLGVCTEWNYANGFEELLIEQSDNDEKENFIAIIHIDGNAMGKRVQEIYSRFQRPEDWNACCEVLRRFSDGIQKDFADCFNQMVHRVSELYLNKNQVQVPIRPVILAGDDVCFITSANIALECTSEFLRLLSKKENVEQPGIPYAACGGVAMVHLKYPVYRAYAMAESLCDSAKKFGASIRNCDEDEGRVSAMDWHIEFGQMKDSLAALREDYTTEDGCRLELRPVTVQVPDDLHRCAKQETQGFRTWGYIKGLGRELSANSQKEDGKLSHGKLKEFRDALRQGEIESRFFLHMREIEGISKWAERAVGHPIRDHSCFIETGHGNTSQRRSLYFDAIEVMDHLDLWEEAENG